MTIKPSNPFPLHLRNFTLLSPFLPLLLPPLARYDIPIKINDEDYERFLDNQPWTRLSTRGMQPCRNLDQLAVGWLSSRVPANRVAEMGLKLPDDLNWIDDDGDSDERLNGQDEVFEGERLL